MPADVSRLGYAREGERFCLMFLDELTCSRHVGGLVFFTPDHQLIGTRLVCALGFAQRCA
jgi:hypothetical protein